jgi:hypothetical protein
MLRHHQGEREFDAKDALPEPDPGSNPSDEMEAAAFEEHEDDPVVEEISSVIDSCLRSSRSIS